MFSVGTSIRDSLPLNFLGKYPNTLEMFDSIRIEGKLKDDAKEINIALKKLQARDSSHLDMHFDVSSQSMKIGHMVKNEIKYEEIDSMITQRYQKGKKGAVSLRPGDMLSVNVIIHDNFFLIAVNDDRIALYNYNASNVKSVDIVEVRGDMECVTAFDTRRLFPIAIPGTQFSAPGNVFSMELCRSFESGLQIIMDALVEGPPDGMFVVYFPSSYRLRTLLWFGVDFATKTIGRKSMDVNMQYINEVYDGPFPIELGKPFRIVFTFGDNEFKFGINGKSIPSYPYPVQIKNEINDPMYHMLMGPRVIVKKGLKFLPKACYVEKGGETVMKSNMKHRIII